MEENRTPASIPGKGQATASMILGIIAVVCWFFGYAAVISIIMGILGCAAVDIIYKKLGGKNG